MNLYFLRHASAGESLVDPKKDEARELDSAGMTQCADIGRALAALKVEVDVIIASPLKRAAQTAGLVGSALGYKGKVQYDETLRPGGTIGRFRRLLEQHAKHDGVMVVGHNPSLSEFLGHCISDEDGFAYVDLKKGAVAKVTMDGAAVALIWCFTPKMLHALLATAASSRGR